MSSLKRRFPPQGKERAPDYHQHDKQRGRLEQRQLWALEAGELGLYLERDWQWPGLRQVGLIRRTRTQMATGQQQVDTTTWVSSLSPQQASPQRIATLLRQHWQIENRLHRVRDVSQSEDLLHGRKIGFALAAIRSLVISLVRLLDIPLLPDAFRYLRRFPAIALALVTSPL